MPQYRVTKYDPKSREATGAYSGHEWTSFSDVGTLVTSNEYERVESAYIDVAIAFMSEIGLETLSVAGLENHQRSPFSFSEGACLGVSDLRDAFQSVLREQMWCRFEHSSGAFVHFGWDYYMYLGVPEECPSAQQLARSRGLFIEPFLSPYRERADSRDA